MGRRAQPGKGGKPNNASTLAQFGKCKNKNKKRADYKCGLCREEFSDDSFGHALTCGSGGIRKFLHATPGGAAALYDVARAGVLRSDDRGTHRD
jgi:hypothetical protein